VAHGNSPIEETRRHAEHVARRADPWIDRTGRAGYAAKGVVYLTIAVLAMREAVGLSGITTGPGDAMRSIGPQPLGGVLVVVLAAGLVGYALWKLVQGIMDPNQKGSDPHGILRRVGYAGSRVIHGGLHRGTVRLRRGR
jgi:hypothetical protein